MGTGSPALDRWSQDRAIRIGRPLRWSANDGCACTALREDPLAPHATGFARTDNGWAVDPRPERVSVGGR